MKLQQELMQKDAWQAFLKRDFLFGRDVYQHFLNFVLAETNSEIGYLHLVSSDEQELELVVWSDKVFEQCTTVHSNHYPVKDAGIWADCIRHGKPQIHNNYPELNEDNNNRLPEGHFPIHRHVSLPVLRAGKSVAVLGFGNRKEEYSEAEVAAIYDTVQTGWMEVTKKLHNIRQREFAQIKRYQHIPRNETLIKILGAISDAFELRDEYTSQHQRNVSVLSHKIAKAMELSERQVDAITIGALVHDIGKIAVPTEILNKLRPLLPAEYALIKVHPKAGADIFKNIDLPFPLTQMIEQHHERLDGSGYPKGLTEKDIILEARIIAVADTFDAMATDRPYRFSPGRQAAIEELKSNRNIKYDPYVVDRFLELLNDDPDLTVGNMYS